MPTTILRSNRNVVVTFRLLCPLPINVTGTTGKPYRLECPHIHAGIVHLILTDLTRTDSTHFFLRNFGSQEILQREAYGTGLRYAFGCAHWRMMQRLVEVGVAEVSEGPHVEIEFGSSA